MRFTQRTKIIIAAAIGILLLLTGIWIIVWLSQHGSFIIKNDNEEHVIAFIQKADQASSSAETFGLEPGQSRRITPERGEYIIRFASQESDKITIATHMVGGISDTEISLPLREQKRDQALGSDLTGCNYSEIANTNETLSYPCDVGYTDFIVHSANSVTPRYISEFSDGEPLDTSPGSQYTTPYRNGMLYLKLLHQGVIQTGVIEATNGRIQRPAIKNSLETETTAVGDNEEDLNISTLGSNLATTNTQNLQDERIALFNTHTSQLLVYPSIESSTPQVIDLSEHVVDGNPLYASIIRLHDDGILFYHGGSDVEGVGDAPQLADGLPTPQKVMNIKTDGTVEQIAELPDHFRVIDFGAATDGTLAYTVTNREATFEQQVYTQQPGQEVQLVDNAIDGCWSQNTFSYIDTEQRLFSYNREEQISFLTYSNGDRILQSISCVGDSTYIGERVNQDSDLLYHAKITNEDQQGIRMSQLLTAFENDPNILQVSPFKNTLRVVTKMGVFQNGEISAEKRQQIVESLRGYGVDLERFRVRYLPFQSSL